MPKQYRAISQDGQAAQEEIMKCIRCRSRGVTNLPDYVLRQHRDSKNREEVYMICPKCGHVRGAIKGK